MADWQAVAHTAEQYAQWKERADAVWVHTHAIGAYLQAHDAGLAEDWNAIVLALHALIEAQQERNRLRNEVQALTSQRDAARAEVAQLEAIIDPEWLANEDWSKLRTKMKRVVKSAHAVERLGMECQEHLWRLLAAPKRRAPAEGDTEPAEE